MLLSYKSTNTFLQSVLKELKEIKRQHDHDLFNITTKKVSLALKWIDECMMTTKWWIHMEDDEIETEIKVLETAIQLCKESKDRKVIILSNDVSLKITSMAEVSLFFFFYSMVTCFSWFCVDVSVLFFLRELCVKKQKSFIGAW